jgi:hypothetical protein
MSKEILIWSFASLANMDLAIAAIRAAFPALPCTCVKGCIDGNTYWRGLNPLDTMYVRGICRGVAVATRDASIG